MTVEVKAHLRGITTKIRRIPGLGNVNVIKVTKKGYTVEYPNGVREFISVDEKHTLETSIPVHHWGTEDSAFDKSSRARATAKKKILWELKHYVGKKDAKKIKIIKGPKFVEFDSGNPYHANAYFEYTIVGPSRIISRIKRKSEYYEVTNKME